MAGTDGALRSSSSTASDTQVDPTDRSSVWDSILSDGIADTGIDPNAPMGEVDDPAANAPQGRDSGLSEGAGSSGSPAAPNARAAGDDGDPSSQSPGSPTEPSGVSGTPSASPDPNDPLAGAEPFTYPVDGTTRTLDGAFRIPGEGLYVPEDRVPQFQLMASRAETLDRTNRELYDRSQSLERLTTWQTKDAQGQPVTLTGQPALMEQRAVMARSLATLNVMTNALKDPDTLASLIAGVDENNRIVLDPRGVSMLETMAENAAIKAESRARAHLSSLSAPPPPVEATVESLAAVTIDAIVAQNGITLTPADKAWAAQHFKRYVTTSKTGRSVDPEFVELLKDRAALRAEQKQVAAAAETAGKFNGGMQRGRSPQRSPAPAPRVQSPAPSPKKVGKAEQWDSVLQSALSEISQV